MAAWKYTHEEPGQEIESISGFYLVDKEIRVKVGSREALCVVGSANWDKSCCGMGGCRYALVPGFIIEYKTETNADGLAVSKVEMINDKTERKIIERIIREAEYVQQVNFW